MRADVAHFLRDSGGFVWDENEAPYDLACRAVMFMFEAEAAHRGQTPGSTVLLWYSKVLDAAGNTDFARRVMDSVKFTD